MTHQDAVEELAVEQYLLGELTGEQRHRFEEHLFDCAECAADLQQGVLFLEGSREALEVREVALEVHEEVRSTTPSIVRSEPKRPFAWLWQPWVMAPALAACLAVIVYQSAFMLPQMKAELAESRTPAVLSPLVLANAGARGGSTDSIATAVAPQHGFYLLSVDIPPVPGVSGYRCFLYSPAGVPVWHVDLSPQQVRDSVTIQVPVMTTSEGINELRVQSIPSSQMPSDTPVDVVQYRYKLSIAK